MFTFNKFLENQNGNNGSLDALFDGSLDIHVRSIKVSNLIPNLNVKTDGSRKLVSGVIDSVKIINIDSTTDGIIVLPSVGSFSEVHIIKNLRTSKNYSIQYNNLQIAKLYANHFQNITFRSLNGGWVI
jgi:hypothetical protein